MIDKAKLYLGEVVDNEPGEKQDNAVRVRVKGLTDDEVIPTDKLPRYPVFMSPHSTPNMGNDLPNIGSRLFVQFPEGDIYNGVCVFSAASLPTE